MKQLVAQVVVAVVLVGVVGFFAWLWRARRASRTAGAAGLERLARELGTTYVPSPMPRLSGTYAGRPCCLAQSRRPNTEDDDTIVRIEIACRSTAGFQVGRRRFAADGDGPDGVRTGEEAFDTQLVVRCADGPRALAVLDPDRRSRLVDWFRRGWVDDLRCGDGQLIIDGGFGLSEGDLVERARRLLQEGAAIADLLEHPREAVHA